MPNTSADQWMLLAILTAAMGLFVWGRPRYDAVALLALLAAVFTGLVPAADAFYGFGHPAVVTVAAVLAISRALRNAGIVDMLAGLLSPLSERPLAYILGMTALCAFASAFMNNIGALAILMPVALAMSLKTGRSPATILMPMSFGAILGGLSTMIGTPPNVIIATYRGDVAGEPFGMFDFTPVGATVALAGVAYLALLGWRLLPRQGRGPTASEQLFQIREYLTEVRVPEGSALVGETLAAFEDRAEGEITVSGLIRGEERRPAPARRRRLRAGDMLILRADPTDLKPLLDAGDLELVGDEKLAPEHLTSDQVALVEAVVPPGAPIVGKTARGVGLKHLHGLNLLGIARQDQPLLGRLRQVRFAVGDVLLLQGDAERMPVALGQIGCLPLMQRGLTLGEPPRLALAFGIIAAALAATAAGLAAAPVALMAAVVLYLLFDFVSPRELYEAVDWPVIVLLGAMIPVGGAIESSGAAAELAQGIAALAGAYPDWVMLALLLVVTMTLSDIMNNAATAVVMAPIAAGIAESIGGSTDAFLMAVAVGASCAFLTPIGHQCNTLVLGPGGYRFGDYWRVGLPLELMIVLLAVPLILFFWGS